MNFLVDEVADDMSIVLDLFNDKLVVANETGDICLLVAGTGKLVVLLNYVLSRDLIGLPFFCLESCYGLAL